MGLGEPRDPGLSAARGEARQRLVAHHLARVERDDRLEDDLELAALRDPANAGAPREARPRARGWPRCTWPIKSWSTPPPTLPRRLVLPPLRRAQGRARARRGHGRRSRPPRPGASGMRASWSLATERPVRAVSASRSGSPGQRRRRRPAGAVDQGDVGPRGLRELARLVRAQREADELGRRAPTRSVVPATDNSLSSRDQHADEAPLPWGGVFTPGETRSQRTVQFGRVGPYCTGSCGLAGLFGVDIDA